MSPKPKNTEYIFSPEVQRNAIETPLKQDLLEYYERQNELYNRFTVGQKTYNILTMIKGDEPASRAMRGDDKARYALTRGGRSAEDIRRAAQRHSDESGRLAVKFSDIAAAPTWKAFYRGQIDSQNLPEEQKIRKIQDSELSVDQYVGGIMLREFKDRFINSSQAAKNRQKAASNLKKGIKLQREMRANLKTSKLGVPRPTFFEDTQPKGSSNSGESSPTSLF